MKKALYPGSFDPITNGHLDILKRALSVFDEVIIAVGTNEDKSPLFSAQERVAIISQVTQGLPIQVVSFDGLLVDFAKAQGITHIVRGLRVLSDFEYEFQLATANRELYSQCDSIFFMTDKNYFYLSSSMIREIAKGGGSVTRYVPPHVEEELNRKFSHKNGNI